MQIMALTLHQPWASLVAIGAKAFETRSWYTAYRGPLVIHAGRDKRASDEIFEVLVKPFTADEAHRAACFAIRDATRSSGYRYLAQLPLGVGLCLVDCIKMTPDFIAAQSANEPLFGLWEPGRYAWKLANVRRFEQPIAAKGAQGLWKWVAPLPEMQP